MAHPPASFLRDSVFMSPFSPSCLSLLVPAFCRKPPKLWVPHEVGQNHSEGWSRFTSRAKPITADLPHYHQQERLGFQNQVARAPWGCAIQQEAWVMLHWVTVLRLQQKTWVWGCAAWEHPFLSTMDQSPLCQRAQKKALAHLLLGPLSTTHLPHLPRRNKRLFFSSLRRLNTLKRGINIYRPSLFPSSVPSLRDYVSALLSWPAFHSRNSPHYPPKRAPELCSSEPVLIHNPK